MTRVDSFPLPRLMALRDELSPVLRDLGSWARAFAERARRGDASLAVDEKSGPGDVVTFADAHVQRSLLPVLARLAPEAGVLGEEEGLDRRVALAPTWVIDPIDGTHNFVRDYPGFCVSVALVIGGESVLGVIYDAGEGSVYAAIRGAGAWRDGVALPRRAAIASEQALIGTNFTAASAANPAHVRLFGVLARRAAGIRSSGAACRDWCHLAAGRTDLFWQFGLQPWDVAAGIVLVREVGGAFALHPHAADWLAGPCDAFAGLPGLVAEAEDAWRSIA
jgi:myo-inositol-1(or 4)-monophosphatase